MKRFRIWLCKWLGHSFSSVDVLMFKISCEGRAYRTDLLTGKTQPLTHAKIKCRRCEEVFTKEL